MIIKIANLSDGVHNYSFDEDITHIGLSEPFYGSVIANVTIAKAHNQLILDAELLLKARFECDRCSNDFKKDISTEYKMVYLLGEEPVESESINITYLAAKEDRINIAQDVKEFALLTIPMKILCSDDCKGLCFKCGKDLNEGECGCGPEMDARWLPLMELKNKLNNK